MKKNFTINISKGGLGGWGQGKGYDGVKVLTKYKLIINIKLQFFSEKNANYFSSHIRENKNKFYIYFFSVRNSTPLQKINVLKK